MGIGRAVATTLGAATSGPLGGLLGNLVGGFLESLFPGLDTTFKAVAANLSHDVVQHIQDGVIHRLFPDSTERQRLNHDLQGAFRDAVCAALYDIGGPTSFPTAWRGGARDVPQAARYPLDHHSAETGARLANSLRELERAIIAGQVLPLDPPAGQTALAVTSYLERDDPLALSALLVDTAVGPFLDEQFASLMAEAPELREHLRRHLLDRALVHLAELLKERPRAWHAFNRLMLEGLRAQLEAIGAGQAEIAARLDTLLAREQGAAVSTLSDDLATLLAATGQAEKRLGESLDLLQTRIIDQHRDVLAQLEALTASSARIERDLARVGRLLERLESGAVVIHGPSPVAPHAAPEPGEPPFLGLRAFDVHDAPRFFGREALAAALARRLRDLLPLAPDAPAAGRFLAVVGASGSGKSSLVQAGLIPALAAAAPLTDGSLPPAGSERWLVRVITPGARPLEALALGLARAQDGVRAAASLAADLAADPGCLDLAARGLLTGRPASERLLLVVDQFEELFTVCKDEAARGAFVAAILAAAATPGPLVAIITLRADFYGACARYEDLRAALSAQQIYIGPMGPDELRRAIEEPARQGGWALEPGLVEVLLHDVGDEPGALPLLSHALLQTWERRRGRTMTLESYVESGMVRGAIAQTAEEVYGRLGPARQALARRVFLRLTEPGADARDTRRRATLEELAGSAEEAPRLTELLAVLADARLITTGDGVAEVAHEALIREWPTLRRWLEEDREGLRVHRALTEHAQEWARLGRDEGALYRGARLATAAEWAAQNPADLNPLEREFLAASQEAVTQAARAAEEARQRELAQARALAEEQRQRAEEQTGARLRQRRLSRFLLVTLACALVAGTSAGIFGAQAWRSAGEAVAARDEARAHAGRAAQQTRAAHAEKLAAFAQQASAENPQLAMLLAVEAVTSTVQAGEPPVPAAEQALRDALALAGRPTPADRYLIARRTPLVFGPDGALYTVDPEGRIEAWAIGPDGPPTLLRTIQAGQPFVEEIAFSPDGALLAIAEATGQSGLGERQVRLFDLRPDGTAAGSEVLPGADRPLAFLPGGRALITADDGNEALIWDLSADPPQATLHDEVWLIPGIPLSALPDGHSYVTGGSSKIQIWDPAAGQQVVLESKQYAAMVPEVEASADGQTLAGGEEVSVRVWDAANLGPEAAQAVLPGAQRPIAFHPSMPLLATQGDFNQDVLVWSVHGGAMPGDPLVLRSAERSDEKGERVVKLFTDLAFSPGGEVLAAGYDDGEVLLWRHGAADPAATRIALQSGTELRFIAYSPDGRVLVTGDRLNTYLWPTEVGPLLARACSLAERNLTLREWQRLIGAAPYRLTCAGRPPAEDWLDWAVGAYTDLARQGHIAEAARGYAAIAARYPSYTFDDRPWLILCRYGALWGRAGTPEVDAACERAIALSKGDAFALDSRGIARALTGDYAGAANDFLAFVGDIANIVWYQQWLDQRKAWIAELRAGRNPLDATTIEQLRSDGMIR